MKIRSYFDMDYKLFAQLGKVNVYMCICNAYININIYMQEIGQTKIERSGSVPVIIIHQT